MQQFSMRSLFEQSFPADKQTEQNPPVVQSEDELEDDGSLMFTPDKVFETPHLLDQILRGIYVKQKVTRAIYNHRFKNYAVKVLGTHVTKINQDRGNLAKALRIGNITIKTFRKGLLAIGISIEDMTVTATDMNGERLEFSLTSFLTDMKDV